MRPLVRLQVRALRVHLLATEELALVYPSLRVGRVVERPAVVFRGGDRGGRGGGRRRRRRRPRHHRDVPGQSGRPHPHERVPLVVVADPQAADVRLAGARAVAVVAGARGLRTGGRGEGGVAGDQPQLEGLLGPDALLEPVLVLVVHLRRSQRSVFAIPQPIS